VANYRVSTNTNNSNKTTQGQRKIDQLRLFVFKREFLQISVDLQTALAAETHRAEGQWLEEQLNTAKLRTFSVGTRMPTDSRAEGQYLAPLKTFIK
jgi:hypothetical protein